MDTKADTSVGTVEKAGVEYLLLKKGGKSMVNGYENATCMHGGTNGVDVGR